MLSTGDIVELSVEKAAAGGRMLARHEGQVVLVAGAVPGERVTARIDRAERKLAFASLVGVSESSPDRRPSFPDPACGGCVYSHIAYARQLLLKADILADAYLRLGRIAIEQPIAVAPSPERAYRTRARFHVQGNRVGFFREGTHALCDPAATGQLRVETLAAVMSVVERVAGDGVAVESVELAESVDASEMAISLNVSDARGLRVGNLEAVVAATGVKGCAVRDARGNTLSVGDPRVGDSLAVLTSGRASSGILHHRPDAFFQGNRFLVAELVSAVLGAVATDAAVLDLYAGVGLFAISLARMGATAVTAVEGDPVSGIDLEGNARQAALDPATVTAERSSVERYLRRRKRGTPPQTVIVDPPRTGMSPEVVQAIVELAAPRVVYVSCDPATMARDARRLLDGGYGLESLCAYDLFPNTPHIEALGVFSLRRSS